MINNIRLFSQLLHWNQTPCNGKTFHYSLELKMHFLRHSQKEKILVQAATRTFFFFFKYRIIFDYLHKKIGIFFIIIIFFMILWKCGTKGSTLVQFEATFLTSLVFAYVFSENKMWHLNSNCALSHKQNSTVKSHY